MPAILVANYAIEGILTIGGVALNCPAWTVQGDENGEGGLAQLWLTGEKSGGDRIVPGGAGVIAYDRRDTATQYDLNLHVIGDVDETNTPYVNSTEGLAANLRTLDDSVFSLNTLTSATLSVPGEAEPRSGEVHIIRVEQTQYHLDDTQAIWEGILRISIPAGRFFPAAGP